MEDSNLANLIFQNYKSSDFGMMVEYPFNIVHATPDIDPTHIKGRNGDFLQDNGSYQNVTETFNVIGYRDANTTQNDWERKVIDWLAPPLIDDARQYEYLQFDYDPDYAFRAVVTTPPTFTWDATDTFKVTGTIPFYCEPYQYRIDGINYSDLPNSGVVYNTETRTAIPDWHFVVNGTFTLNINNLQYEFDNMEGEFWLSGDTSDTYDSQNNYYNNQTHFPNLVAPVLYPGRNEISITAESETTISKAEYKPKWRRLI